MSRNPGSETYTDKSTLEASDSLLEALLGPPPAVSTLYDGVFCATCLEAAPAGSDLHVLASFRNAAGAVVERRIRRLIHLSFGRGDKVLAMTVSGETEAVGVGVIERAPSIANRPSSTGCLVVADTARNVRITAINGTPLLELVQDAEGLVVRLLTQDTRLELPGKLQLTADQIELSARQGDVRLEAAEDVIVLGTTIQLN